MKRFWSGAIATALLLLTGLFAAPTASASGALGASDPAPREELDAAPGGVTLAFDREIKPDSAKVLVLDPSGRNVVVGDLDYFGSTVALLLKADLPRGTYTVRYRITGSNGQPEGGSFQFAIGRGTWTDPLPDESWSGSDAQPPDLANPDPQATEAEESPGPDPTQTPDGSEEPEIEFETVTPEATPTPGETATTPASPTESPAAPSGSSEGTWWPWALGGAIVVATAGIGAWLAARNRRTGGRA